jgi:hypothetical protein
MRRLHLFLIGLAVANGALVIFNGLMLRRNVSVQREMFAAIEALPPHACMEDEQGYLHILPHESCTQGFMIQVPTTPPAKLPLFRKP